MNGIFYVKSVVTLEPVTNRNGELISKKNVVLSNRICRNGDDGAYAAEQDYAIDLLGERADAFTLQTNDLLAAELSFAARPYNNTHFPEIRLLKYAKI